MSQPIRIQNRVQKYTSRRTATSFVERGIAEWTDESHTAIRFREAEEDFKARVARQEQRYWRGVAAQRGGKEVIFIWKVSISADGYTVMGATPVPI